jgi:hypothetical protein
MHLIINAGVQTALTPGYVNHFRALTGTATLVEALKSLRTEPKGGLSDG